VLFIISKDSSAFSNEPHHPNVNMDTVLNFKVPLYYMAGK